MKAHSQFPFRFALWGALAILMLLATGCKTAPKVDWNSRVGNYTFDQAVEELGPPDRQAKTSDGKTVAEWISHHSGGGSFSVGTGFYGSHSAVGIGTTTGSGYRDRVLR